MSDFFSVHTPEDMGLLEIWLGARRYNSSRPSQDRHGKNIIGLQHVSGGKPEKAGVVWLADHINLSEIRKLVEKHQAAV